MRYHELFESTSTVKVWHVTRQAAIKRIMTQGLVPKIGPRSKQAKEKANAIYVFTDFSDIESAIMNWIGDEFSETTKLSILELDVPRDWIIPILGVTWEATIEHAVPPNIIKVLISDIDGWDGKHPLQEAAPLENQTYRVIGEKLYAWVTSNLNDYAKRERLLGKILELPIPDEFKTVPSAYLYRFGQPQSPVASFAYRVSGAKHIKKFYLNRKEDTEIITFPVSDVEIIINIPLFFQKTKVYGYGKQFMRMVSSEYEVIGRLDLLRVMYN